MKNNFKNKIKMDKTLKIDFNYCLARRNQNSLYNMQCPHLKKHGDFCGKHKNYLNKKLIPINVNDNQENYKIEKYKNRFKCEKIDIEKKNNNKKSKKKIIIILILWKLIK